MLQTGSLIMGCLHYTRKELQHRLFLFFFPFPCDSITFAIFYYIGLKLNYSGLSLLKTHITLRHI